MHDYEPFSFRSSRQRMREYMALIDIASTGSMLKMKTILFCQCMGTVGGGPRSASGIARSHSYDRALFLESMKYARSYTAPTEFPVKLGVYGLQVVLVLFAAGRSGHRDRAACTWAEGWGEASGVARSEE